MRERAEEWTLRTLAKYGSLEGERIPKSALDSLVKKGLIREVVRMYFGPRAWKYTLSPAGVRACAELPKVEPQ